MGYLCLRLRSLGLKIVLCLGGYVLLELQEPDFMFLAKGPESILGARIFLKRSI